MNEIFQFFPKANGAKFGRKLAFEGRLRGGKQFTLFDKIKEGE